MLKFICLNNSKGNMFLLFKLDNNREVRFTPIYNDSVVTVYDTDKNMCSKISFEESSFLILEDFKENGISYDYLKEVLNSDSPQSVNGNFADYKIKDNTITIYQSVFIHDMYGFKFRNEYYVSAFKIREICFSHVSNSGMTLTGVLNNNSYGIPFMFNLEDGSSSFKKATDLTPDDIDFMRNIDKMDNLKEYIGETRYNKLVLLSR